MASPLVPLDSSALPPSVRLLLRDTLALVPDGPIGEPSPLLVERLEQLSDAAEPWAFRAPELAALGERLLDRREHPATRRLGCVWLTLFPTEDVVDVLARVALATDEPRDVRDQAAWSLGFRQAQHRHPSYRWTDAVTARADAALLALVRQEASAGKVTLEMLPESLRHVDCPEVLDELAKHPLLWGGALEAFATPALARAALERLPELGEHAPRAARLAAATLGEEAVPRLLALAEDADLAERLELLFDALPFGGEAVAARLDATFVGLARAEPLRARVRWHLDNPGVLPTVRGLAVARTAARLAPEERAAACARAADHLAVLAHWVPYAEGYLYDLWSWMVHLAGDPARARRLAALHPASRELNRRLVVRDLVETGRVRRAMTAAHELGITGEAAWWLATHGRPFFALELVDKQREGSAEALAARAVAAFLAGRPDLARQLLASESPPVAAVDGGGSSFPGADERWRAEHEPDARPALTVLVRAHLAHPGDAEARARAALSALLDHAKGAPEGADPDAPDLALLHRLAARVRSDLDGRSVYLAGELDPRERARLVASLEKRGARLVAGAFPGTDYYVLGERCDVSTVARLERQGAKRIAAPTEAQ